MHKEIIDEATSRVLFAAARLLAGCAEELAAAAERIAPGVDAADPEGMIDSASSCLVNSIAQDWPVSPAEACEPYVVDFAPSVRGEIISAVDRAAQDRLREVLSACTVSTHACYLTDLRETRHSR